MRFDGFPGSGHAGRPYRVCSLLVSGFVLLGSTRGANPEAEAPCKGDPTLCDSATECVNGQCDWDNPDADENGCVWTYKPSKTPCGDPSDTEWDESGACDGAGTCVGNNQGGGSGSRGGCSQLGDICEPFDPPNAPQPDLDDVLCVLDDWADGLAVDGCPCNGFRFSTDLFPCCPDDEINLDDILSMLNAFTGNPPCPYWCDGELCGCCLLEDGSEIIVAHAQCDDEGGVYFGDGSEVCGPEKGTMHCPPGSTEEDCECPEPNDIDPVYLFSGEFYLSEVDMRIPGRGLDFVWSRKYRSRIGPDTDLGNGWDFSYNIRIKDAGGGNLELRDGNTRTDVYTLQPDGSWSRGEFFRRIVQDPDDGSYTLTFPSTGTWDFHALDDIPKEGKIRAITDRNGNTTAFTYDDSGRLTTITDTLGRDIDFTYAGDFIESVTDYTGRQVKYDYYQAGDAGGSFGDLKSVTTPTVTGTPNGNNFPFGKKTIYTYSKGSDERLKHNLLTIEDPKGQLYLRNVYGEDPADLEYDRIIRQYWGDQDPETGDIVDVVYVPQTPIEENNRAIIKVIINDRVGNVKEYFYDHRNRGVIQREYTGRALPDQPTTELDNRPTAPLRDDDPPYFETRYEYNDDSLRTKIIHPNGNEETFLYDSGNEDPRLRGNLLEHCRLPGPLGGDQSQICEQFTYFEGMGGCCGSRFVENHTDGRGNGTHHDYDLDGNRTKTTHRITSIVEDWVYNDFGQMTEHVLPSNEVSPEGNRRLDVYTYYESGSQLGYLHEEKIDAEGFELTTVYDYDEVGNVISVTDPRGNKTEYIVNQLDQVVREKSRPVDFPDPKGGDPIVVQYERDTFYDANDNVIRVDVQNVDENGAEVPANTHFSTIYEYEILNYPTKMCQEVGQIVLTSADLDCSAMPASESITTEYDYDESRNRTLVTFGEAVNGNDTDNVVSTLYDERDLVYQEIRAPGVVGPGGKSTDQTDYDGNKNVQFMRQGLEGPTNSPPSAVRVTANTYDGYDRTVTSTDPMGNVMTYQYDANHNRVSGRTDGELQDIEGGAGNMRLSEANHTYDDMDRLTQTDVVFFDTISQNPILDGLSTSLTEYSDNSQVTRVVNDNLHERTTAYDSANRRSVVTDHVNNTMTYTYDANSNVIAMTELEKSDLGNKDEAFTTTRAYDNLDRLISTTDNYENTDVGAVGNTYTYAYDSRDNRTLLDDALSNETRYDYDGINRLIATVRDLDGDGADGDGDDITTTQAWDDDSRLIAQTDDSDNVTRYAYDALNRLIITQMADGTIHQTGGGAVWAKGELQPDLAGFTSGYDVHDNKVTINDANGSESTSTYDLLDRLLSKTIVPEPPVSDDTTLETYKYDGLSRLVHAEDNDSLVTRSYDSLSHITSETLDGQTTTCLFDGVGNDLTSTYPGGRVVTTTYDGLEHKKRISDAGGTIARYAYVGPGRVERREYGNGTRTAYTYDGITGMPNPPGDFGVKRIIATTHSVISGGSAIDDRTYTWDRMYNKTQRKDERTGVPRYTHDYMYDSIYRLVHTTVTDTGAIVVRDTDYDLDGVGNRTKVIGAPDSGPHVGQYTMDGTQPVPADEQMNQYTTVPAAAERRYDENGNLITVDNLLPTQRDIAYNYRNQMVEYTVIATGERHTYAYDALGRRIARVVDADGVGGGPTETRYFYDGWQVVEEQDAAGATQATYVYGLYIDAVLNMQRDTQGDRAPEDYYYHADDLYNVMAVTDAAGTVIESYEYADYGQPIDPTTLAPITGDPSAVGNPYGFTGRRYDPETGWYYYRTRYLDPVAGRFTTRDTIGIWGNALAFGNGLSAFAQNPWSRRDPSGLFEIEWESSFTQAEQSRITDSFERIRDRITDLQRQFADQIAVLGLLSSGLSGTKAACCFRTLARDLLAMNSILDKIAADLDSSWTNLEIYNSPNADSSTIAQMSSGSGTVHDSELTYNTTHWNPGTHWATSSPSQFDSINLHELSHIHGTGDQLHAVDWWNDAYNFGGALPKNGGLANTDLADLPAYLKHGAECWNLLRE